MKLEQVIEKIAKNKQQYKSSFNRYAVYAPIIKVNNQAHLLFEVRSNKLTSQPGEISFPGGKIEQFESWRTAALRETCEELNVTYKDLEWISDLNIANLSNSRIVYAGIGLLKKDVSELIPNKDEVYKIFTVPIDYFLNYKVDIYQVETEMKPPPNFPYDLIPNGKKYNWNGRGYEVPFFKYEDQVIWGLTARIIIDIVQRLKN
jgi:8-oxo-dGTP pyrophosphatase MutT (NUDIX family)